MNSFKLLAVWMLCAYGATASAGDIKKCVDADGNVHFGDTPPPRAGAEHVEVTPAYDGGAEGAKRSAEITEMGQSIWADDRKRQRERDKANDEWLADHEAKKKQEAANREAWLEDRVIPGMTAEQVRRIWGGGPNEINRDNFGDSWEEQWVYDNSKHHGYVYVEDGKVTAVQYR